MVQRVAFLSKTLKRIPSYKNKNQYEQKLTDIQTKLDHSEHQLAASKQQARFDKKLLDDTTKDRDAWRAKHAHLQDVLARYASDMCRIKQAEERLERQDRRNMRVLAQQKQQQLADKTETEPPAPPYTADANCSPNAPDPASTDLHGPEVRHDEPLQLSTVPTAALAVVHPPRRRRPFVFSKRLAVIPLLFLLSAITKLMQRRSTYADGIDFASRPFFAGGAVVQMTFFNVIVVSLVGELAEYVLHAPRDDDDAVAQLGGGSFVRWGFVAAVCEEAWKVLLTAGLALMLLLFEVQFLFV